MALTLRKVPQELQPTYNQVIIAATSSEQGELNYQLISELTCRGELISRLKSPVNPEGFIVVDYHKHLGNQVSFDFLIGPTGFSIATGSFASYSIAFFDEFRHEWNFVDNFFSVIGPTAFAGFQSQQEPYFSIGEEVYIAQAPGFSHSAYNGVHTIIALTQSGLTWSITVDVPFAGSSPLNPGVMTYADFQLTTLPVGELTIFSTPTQSATASVFPRKYVFNGVENFVDFISWNFDEYDANTGTLGKFFTNAPEGFPLGTSSRLALNVYQNADDEIGRFRVQSNLGTFSINNPHQIITPDNKRFLQINASPQNLFNLGFINNATTEINIWCENKFNVQTIATKRFTIERPCSPYEDLQVIFMDGLGSFVSYIFNRLHRETKTIARANFGQIYGSYAPATQGFIPRTFDRGTKSLDTIVNEVFTATSDWVKQADGDYLMELFQSPEVYLVRPDGVIVAITLTVESIERKQIINEQCFNYTINFELSNKNMSQK